MYPERRTEQSKYKKTVGGRRSQQSPRSTLCDIRIPCLMSQALAPLNEVPPISCSWLPIARNYLFRSLSTNFSHHAYRPYTSYSHRRASALTACVGGTDRLWHLSSRLLCSRCSLLIRRQFCFRNGYCSCGVFCHRKIQCCLRYSLVPPLELNVVRGTILLFAFLAA
jgi:hypothetical protein